MNKYDVVVIGGGLSGSTVAASLVRAEPTARVLVIERERYGSRIAGCEVCEGASVIVVRTIEDRVDSVLIRGNQPFGADDDGWVYAKQFVDASGWVGVIGRFMGGHARGSASSPRKLAIWGCWTIPHWPDGWPRRMMKSLAGGCLWLIPISERFVSVGFIAPADFCENSTMTRAELYAEAIIADAQIEKLMAVSQPEGPVRCSIGPTHLPNRPIGDNWMLVGESAGFADPVQSVGMSLSEIGADEAASVIAACLRREPNYMRRRAELSESQSQRLSEFMKLENSWYAATSNMAAALPHRPA